MPESKIINSIDKIKFNNEDEIVSEKNNKLGSDHKDRKYQIIEKREHTYSSFEGIKRGFLETLAGICFLCPALFSKFVQTLFTFKENIRFAFFGEQTRFKVEDGKVIFLGPKILFKGTKISKDQELNFAVVKTNGKLKLVPVTSFKNGNEYRTYEGTALEALLKLAQDKEPQYMWWAGQLDGSPICHILKHPNNSIITEEEFFKFILEKDEAGTPKICTLNSDSTLEVLSIIKEKSISINLNEKTSKGETLFTLWVGKGESDITKLMIELDPSVIEQTRGQIKSAFVEAVLNGSKEEAGLLIDAMNKKGFVLSQEELWIQRAFKNDCVFSEKEFYGT